VKLLVSEAGTAEAATAWIDADRRVSSLLLYPEARAALGRARRIARIGPRQAALARRRLDRLWTAVDRVEPTEALARAAGELADRHALRAYDAVHLASVRAAADDDLVLVAADDALLTAARSLGLATADVSARRT
jgi:uncharacterized protein